MVEYETIGIVAIIVGIISYQIKTVKDNFEEKLNAAVETGNKEHKALRKDIGKLRKIVLRGR